MKIALINATSHLGFSASGFIIENLAKKMDAEYAIIEMHGQSVTQENLRILEECEAWVFAFPLYVDGVPSHLLSCMRQIEKQMRGRNVRVCAICNCGFYEGRQNRHALAIVKNWCSRAGFSYCMGIGMGAGGAIDSLAKYPLDGGPLSPLGEALGILVQSLSENAQHEDIFTTVAFPRFLYRIGAEQMWRAMAKANGLTMRALDRKIVVNARIN